MTWFQIKIKMKLVLFNSKQVKFKKFKLCWSFGKIEINEIIYFVVFYALKHV